MFSRFVELLLISYFPTSCVDYFLFMLWFYFHLWFLHSHVWIKGHYNFSSISIEYDIDLYIKLGSLDSRVPGGYLEICNPSIVRINASIGRPVTSDTLLRKSFKVWLDLIVTLLRPTTDLTITMISGAYILLI